MPCDSLLIAGSPPPTIRILEKGPLAGNMNSGLNDEQWNRLLDNMAHRQPSPPALHVHAGDTGYGNFSAENLNHTANDGLAHSANYAEPNLSSFAAPRFPEIRDIDDHSLADLRALSKELEIVKQR